MEGFAAPAPGRPAVEAQELTKRFGSHTAVDAIDFVIGTGETFALLGPNGAGKSSTMKMISTVSPRTSGRLTVLGMDPDRDGRRIRARLGVVPQDDILDWALTVRENLTTYARYFDISRREARRKADELLEFVQLAERAEDKVQPLSGGMKRRLSIARSLVNDPDLILLDEPTTGLDPQARHLLWERLRQLKQRGVTQLLTTHYMDEAEQLADRLVIMDRGGIVAAGTPAELIAAHTSREVVELRFGNGQPSDDRLVPMAERLGLRTEVLADRTLVYAHNGDEAVTHLADLGIHPRGTLVRRATLEDVFLALTGRSLSE